MIAVVTVLSQHPCCWQQSLRFKATEVREDDANRAMHTGDTFSGALLASRCESQFPCCPLAAQSSVLFALDVTKDRTVKMWSVIRLDFNIIFHYIL